MIVQVVPGRGYMFQPTHCSLLLGSKLLYKSMSLYWLLWHTFYAAGIWATKILTPTKMLIGSVTTCVVATAGLMFFVDEHPAVLWSLTVVIGLSFSTITGSQMAWAARHYSGMC